MESGAKILLSMLQRASRPEMFRLFYSQPAEADTEANDYYADAKIVSDVNQFNEIWENRA